MNIIYDIKGLQANILEFKMINARIFFFGVLENMNI